MKLQEELNMKISYNNLLKMLIDRNLTKKDLVRVAGVTTNVCTSISRREPIPMAAMLKICKAFNCTVNDVMEVTFL